ncbi:MAG: DUF1080 domain-containing protein [Planctomycetota bacterium]
MIRRADFLLMMAAWALAGTVWAAESEIAEPEEAKADPDFAVQGEYLGEGVMPDGEHIKAGAQVIALGGGEFALVFYEGGLPGAGWKRDDGKLEAAGRREGEVTVISSEDVKGKIADGKMTISDNEGNGRIELKCVERKSPTLGQKPPEGAVVLFDGSGTDYFPGATMTEEKNLLSGTLSKAEFADAKIHLEFRLTWMPDARGQGRSNSGVYVHNCYEIQVLDSFGLEGHDNECGGLYSIKAPDVNMCLPPLVWQTYDVDFTAPKFDASGNKVSNGRLTLKHNGVVIHDGIELPHACPGGQGEGPGPRGIQLQGHGCHVQYRNIWGQKKE